MTTKNHRLQCAMSAGVCLSVIFAASTAACGATIPTSASDGGKVYVLPYDADAAYVPAVTAALQKLYDSQDAANERRDARTYFSLYSNSFVYIESRAPGSVDLLSDYEDQMTSAWNGWNPDNPPETYKTQIISVTVSGQTALAVVKRSDTAATAYDKQKIVTEFIVSGDLWRQGKDGMWTLIASLQADQRVLVNGKPFDP